MTASGLYTERVLDHYRNPRNCGEIEGADAVSKEQNSSCGDEVTFYLKIIDDERVQVRFTSKSCAICRASASMLAELANGKKLSDVAALGREDMLRMFGGSMDPVREKCALLPLAAMKSAVSKVKKNP
ncbi:MAG TPA: iron-sulfur cluster assembly scaffold protein [Thermoproteota archaeon]|nr:iron-sulfur cluster assembly scaffold protein [Thermoproteota archaeon]